MGRDIETFTKSIIRDESQQTHVPYGESPHRSCLGAKNKRAVAAVLTKCVGAFTSSVRAEQWLLS